MDRPDEFPAEAESVYAEIRDTIRSGDILLCSGSGWFSRMIQRGTGSIWSHVAFVMWLDRIDRLMVLESVETIGVRTVPLSTYLRDYDSKGNPYPGRLAILRHRGIEHLAADAFEQLGRFAVDRLGYPYDNQEIAKIAARIGASAFGFDDGEVVRDREFICSEFAYECFRSVGIEIPYDRRGFIAPADYARCAATDLVAVLKA